MSRSPRKQPRSYQVTIDELDIDWEHIPGSVPAAEDLAHLARSKAIAAWFAAADPECIPDQMIHVYSASEKLCVCKTRKRKERK